MTAAHPADGTGGARRDEGGRAALVVGNWLRLAAAPTFAVLALCTVVLGDGHADPICSPGGHGSPLTGMAMMYGLMSAFHLPVWLRLISCQRAG